MNLKNLIVIFLVYLTLTTSSKTEEIEDFEIEGISVGDSLLNYMSYQQIKDYDQGHYNKDSEFFETQLPNSKGNYDYILFHIKRKDKKYRIELIRGAILVSDLKSCTVQKKNVLKEMKTLFAGVKLREGKQKHYFYKNSMQYISQFEFRNGDLVKLECVIYSDKDRQIHPHIRNTFEVSIGSAEFYDWLAKISS